MTGFDPALVSNNILQRAFADGVGISPMKLQKILYFAASEYAKSAGEPLLDGRFEAWKYGPVLPAVFQEFKNFSGSPITAYTRDASGRSYTVDESINPLLRDVLDRVWAQTRGRSAVDLSKLTHTPGSAWYTTYTSWKNQLDDDAVQADVTYKAALGL